MRDDQPAEALDPAHQVRLDEFLCFPLYAATRAVTRAYGELLAESGLTYPQYLVVVALGEAGEMSVGSLGARLRLDSGTLTPLLKRLEAASLVARRRDADDERRVLVALTEQGSGLRDQLADVPHRLAVSMGIDRAQAEELRTGLDRLLAHLDQGVRSGGPASSRGSSAR